MASSAEGASTAGSAGQRLTLAQRVEVIQQRKRQAAALPRARKLEKLAIYSGCKVNAVYINSFQCMFRCWCLRTLCTVVGIVGCNTGLTRLCLFSADRRLGVQL